MEMQENKIIRIAVVDDESEFTSQIEKIVDDFFENKKMIYEIKIYNLPMELLWDIEDHQYFDIYFIDIEMPGLGGMDLADAIRQRYDEPYIIFVTSFMEYSIRGYEYGAFRYIIKDQMYEKLPIALNKLLEKLSNVPQRLYIIETHSKVIKIVYEDIYYLHIDGKYTNFYTKTGDFRERKALNKVFETLNAKEFIYTDKGYVVNLRHVITLKKGSVVMRCLRGMTDVPVSIPQYKKVKQAISEFWRAQR